MDQLVRKRVADFIKTNGDMGIERLDAEEHEANEIISMIGSSTLFASKKFIILRGLSKNSDLSERVDDLLALVDTDTELIIIEPQIDKRSKLFNKLKSQTELRESLELPEPMLADWLVSEAKTLGGSIKRTEAVYLIEKTGLNQGMLSAELNKLLLFDKDITKETIDLLVEPSPQSDIFALVEAAFSGNKSKVARLYSEQRALKVEPIQIIGLITWQLHLIATVQAAGSRNPMQIANDLGTYPSVISRTMSLARRISKEEIRQRTVTLLAMDDKLKTQSVNADDVLLYFLLSF